MKNPVVIPPGRYIDPLTDFGFKQIFGSEPQKELLMAFLNVLFNGRKAWCITRRKTMARRGITAKPFLTLPGWALTGKLLLLKYNGQTRNFLRTGPFFLHGRQIV